MWRCAVWSIILTLLCFILSTTIWLCRPESPEIREHIEPAKTNPIGPPPTKLDVPSALTPAKHATHVVAKTSGKKPSTSEIPKSAKPISPVWHTTETTPVVTTPVWHQESISDCPTTAACGCSRYTKSSCGGSCCRWYVGSGCSCR